MRADRQTDRQAGTRWWVMGSDQWQWDKHNMTSSTERVAQLLASTPNANTDVPLGLIYNVLFSARLNITFVCDHMSEAKSLY